MKKKVLTIAFLVITSIIAFAQTKNVPVNILLKEGGNIMAHHFGQAECDGNEFMGYIMLKGKYMNQVTEIKDYSTISKIELMGYDKAPASSVGNQKGKITVYKKSGVTVTLEDAELIISCMGVDEFYNQLKVILINPLTDKKFEQTIDMMNIKTIVFQ